MYGEICAIIQTSIKKLLQFIHSKLGQILHVDKTGFLGPPGPITYCTNIYGN